MDRADFILQERPGDDLLGATALFATSHIARHENNGAAGYQGPVKSELRKGAVLLIYWPQFSSMVRLTIIIHQVFLLARDWSKRLT